MKLFACRGLSQARREGFAKTVLIMKLSLFLIVVCCLNAHADGFSQKLTITQKNASLEQIFKEINKQTGYTFVYTESLLKGTKKVTITATNATLEQVLNECLKDQSLTYSILNELVILKQEQDKVYNSPPPPPPPVAITGKVANEKGEPLVGASIVEKGGKSSTTSNGEGRFTISVSNATATLVVTYVGYQAKEIPLNNQTDVSVVLALAAAQISEAIVIGYGSVQKKDLTSAVSTVRSKDFLQGAVNSPLQMIDGKVAGVTISNVATADPNRSADVQVRGAASLEAGTSPLIVIDGMPGGDLRNVTQQDIESITVLKDASSAAIYGSRGANGVILVTTKKGRAGTVNVTYDSYVEKDYVASKPDLLSPEEFLERKRDIDNGARTNWYDELIRTNNFGQNHFLSISGGNPNTIFRISGNYKKKTGIDIASDRKEYGLRANFLQKALNGFLEVGGNISYRVANEEFTNYGAFQQAVKLNPTIPVMDPNNPQKYNTLLGYDTYNPVQDLLTRENGADHTYSIVDFNIRLNLLKNLNTELKLARQGHDRLGREYYTSAAAESVTNSRTGRARLQDEKWVDYTLEWLGNYALKLDKHDVKILGGYSYQEFNNRGFWAENMNFPSDAFGYNNLDAGAWNLVDGRLGMDSWRSREKTIAFLGRATYNFNNTYFVTASFRYEGNTKFGANNKWGMFPAASAAWRISNLPVFANSKAINDLKLRASYGVTGRSGFPRYTSLSRYQGYGRYQNDNGEWIQVYGPANNFNPNLKWEKAISYNVGVDFSLFDSRLSGSIDWFNRKSTDLLSNYDVPVGSYVQDQMFVNVGNSSSKGIELNLNWDVVRGKDFTYSTNFTGSYIKSKLLSWSNDQYHANYRELQNLPSPGNPGSAYRLEDNTEIGRFYGLKFAGVDDQGKMLIWKDGIEGKEKIEASASSSADRTYIGHGAPHYELSWGNTIGYKGFDLSLFFRGRFDYQILNLYQMYYGLQAEPNVNLLRDAYTRNGKITSPKVISDYFLENGDYVRLENITLGWSPKIPIKQITSFRLYATVRNVFTSTKFTGLDPSSVGVTGLTPGYGDLNVYPTTRTFSVGAQVSF
jgi:TonB-linked SusC/RagA family outer membrane protein